jgi:hypothetical protein
MTTATADDDNSDGGRRQRRTTMALEIGRQTMRGKEESRRKTTTASEPTGRAESMIKYRNQVYAKRLFSVIRSVRLDFLFPSKHPTVCFRFISLMCVSVCVNEIPTLCVYVYGVSTSTYISYVAYGRN